MKEQLQELNGESGSGRGIFKCTVAALDSRVWGKPGKISRPAGTSAETPTL